MDYPDVSLVVQVGLPANKEQYVHRLGRTARAGKEGRGILLLSSFETRFLDELHQEPLQQQPPAAGRHLRDPVVRAFAKVRPETIALGYKAWLGFYNSNLKKVGGGGGGGGG